MADTAQAQGGPDEAIAVPSGQPVTFLDAQQGVPGPDGLTTRFRFVAPRIARQGGDIDAETAQADMTYLCETYVLPRLSATGPVPSQIVISLSDRPLAFGEPAPEATQFFEAYSFVDDHCVWEPF